MGTKLPYKNLRSTVSANGSTWTTIFDSAVSGEYAETAAGRTHTFTAQSVRYVREYLNGLTANSGDHWVEMEVFGSRTNAYIGDYFEWNDNTSTMVKYYYAGSEHIAMREGTGTGTSGLKWLLGDHLGSTSITADGASGAKLSELRYKPWGELRYAQGTTTTSLRYTGQRMEGIGLYDYGARFFDPMLGRFIQPDPLIPEPGNPVAWDKYAYAGNNPIRYNDPTGHWLDTVFDVISIVADVADIAQNGLNWGNGLALAADVASVLIPGVTGAGVLVKAAMHADDAVDAVRAVDRVSDVVDAVKAAENATEAAQAVNQGENLAGIANVVGDFCSFTPETHVATAEGAQEISQVEAGELVLAYDEALGVTEYYTVTAVLEHVDLIQVTLTIDGERIQTTPEHPFYVEGYGWVPAGELWAGAQVGQRHAGAGVVEDLSFALRPQRMYNLTVAQAHTFFVGQGQWLVHNTCFQLGSAGQHIPVGSNTPGGLLAQDAKNLYANLPHAATQDTTIALGLLDDGSIVRAVNGEASSGVANALGAMQAPNMGPTGHAERFLYDTYGSRLQMMAASQPPCRFCADYLKGKGIPFFFERGRYVRGY